jgi:hypothetical protein
MLMHSHAHKHKWNMRMCQYEWVQVCVHTVFDLLVWDGSGSTLLNASDTESNKFNVRK